MTERLYYKNPGLLTFEGEITETGRAGGRYFTVLDQSAFYPTSGGQLFDTGLLGAVRVEDVIETDDGEVQHLSSAPVGEVGQRMRGVVDAQRRKMHRQQHTAQHILSGSFYKLFGYETVSVHLGEEYGAIELGVDTISDEQIREGEELAESVVFADRRVEILFLPRDEALKLPLRKTPAREGIIRVIKIHGFDNSACGGTHCDSTAQVGMLKIIGIERMRGHALVNFLAGEQAKADYSARLAVTTQLSHTFTCHPYDLVEIVGKLDGESKKLRREIGRLQKELMPSQAAELAARGMQAGTRRLVVAVLSEYDAKLAVQLGVLVAEQVNGVSALLVEGRLLLAVGLQTDLHAGNLVKALAAETGLRGGGGPTQAQLGGASPAQLDVYRAALEKLVREA